MALRHLSFFSILCIYFTAYNQSIDTFNYDFVQINHSPKLDRAMTKLNSIKNALINSSTADFQQEFIIVHFGDSHIQGDYFSGEFRRTLQSYFGASGSGIIFPYSLCKSFGPRGLQSSKIGLWKGTNILNSSEKNKIGLAGYELTTSDTISKLKFQFSEKFNASLSKTLKIWYLLDSTTTNFNLTNEFDEIKDTQYDGGWGVRTYNYKNAISDFEVSIKSKKNNSAEFTFHGFELDQPIKNGIKYHQCGVVGAQFSHLINNSNLIVSQLKYLEPDLIVFSFGTNEAYDNNIDSSKYFNQLNKFISQLNLTLPNTAIIFTTAPDTRSQGKVPSNQISINNQLIKISKTHDLSLFDLNKAMGGWGSLNGWYKNNLVSSDKLHFSSSGYSLQGKLFSLAFLENYNSNFNNDSVQLNPLRDDILNKLKPVLTNNKIEEVDINHPTIVKPIKLKIPKKYIVKKGDTIFKIAKKLNVSGKKILRLNNLNENSIIRPGQVIKIP